MSADLTIFQKELHQAFLATKMDQKSRQGSSSTQAAVDSCLRRLLDKKKARLAQYVALFLQVGLNSPLQLPLLLLENI